MVKFNLFYKPTWRSRTGAPPCILVSKTVICHHFGTVKSPVVSPEPAISGSTVHRPSDPMWASVVAHGEPRTGLRFGEAAVAVGLPEERVQQIHNTLKTLIDGRWTYHAI